jgi:hypothetical protein
MSTPQPLKRKAFTSEVAEFTSMWAHPIGTGIDITAAGGITAAAGTVGPIIPIGTIPVTWTIIRAGTCPITITTITSPATLTFIEAATGIRTSRRRL